MISIEKMNIPTLKKELAGRNLPTSGTKAELKLRLEEESRKEGKYSASSLVETEESSKQRVSDLSNVVISDVLSQLLRQMTNLTKQMKVLSTRTKTLSETFEVGDLEEVKLRKSEGDKPEGEDLQSENEEDDDGRFIIDEAEVNDENGEEEAWKVGVEGASGEIIAGIVGNEVGEVGPTAREIEGRRRRGHGVWKKHGLTTYPTTEPKIGDDIRTGIMSPKTNTFIARLSEDAKAQELRRMFEQYGVVTETEILYKPEGEDLQSENEENDDGRFIIDEAEVNDENGEEEAWKVGVEGASGEIIAGIVGNEVGEVGPTAREIEGRRRRGHGVWKKHGLTTYPTTEPKIGDDIRTGIMSPKTNTFIARLSEDAKAQELRRMFEQYGVVTETEILYKPEGEDLQSENEENDDGRFIIDEAEVNDENGEEEAWKVGVEGASGEIIAGIVGNEVGEVGPTAREIEGRRRRGHGVWKKHGLTTHPTTEPKIGDDIRTGIMSPKTNIFIARLSEDAKAQELRRMFEQYGVVTESEILNLNGFVHTKMEGMAAGAIEALNNTEFLRAETNVEQSTGKKSGREKGFGPMMRRRGEPMRGMGMSSTPPQYMKRDGRGDYYRCETGVDRRGPGMDCIDVPTPPSIRNGYYDSYDRGNDGYYTATCQFSNEPLQIMSVKALEGLKGYNYFESYKVRQVKHSIVNVGHLRMGRSKQHILAIKEISYVLRAVKEKKKGLKPKQRVRLKRAVYSLNTTHPVKVHSADWKRLKRPHVVKDINSLDGDEPKKNLKTRPEKTNTSLTMGY